MTTGVYVQPPSQWPFKQQSIPGRLMPSRKSYTQNNGGLIYDDERDVQTLISSYGFFQYGTSMSLEGLLAGLAGAGDATKYLNGTGALSTPAGGGGGALLSLAVPVLSAQLLACHDTPVEIIPAAGAGKFIVLLADSWEYVPGDTGYTIDTNVDLFYSNDLVHSIGDIDMTFFMTGTSYDLRSGAAATGTGKPALNSSVVLYAKNANPTDGDGDINVYVDYLIKTSIA